MKRERFTLPVASILLLFLLGCAAHSPHNYTYVSDSLRDRSGSALKPEGTADTLKVPPSVELKDGLSEEEAVTVALWNNPQYQSDLQRLGFARADLIEAGMFRNPVLSFLFPLGPKQMEFAVNMPVEVLWQRPFRVSMAKKNAESVARNLIQDGLALARDVRISLADQTLALKKAGIACEQAKLDSEIAYIALARLRAGDISELEETVFRLAAAETKEKAIQFNHDARQTYIEMQHLLGFAVDLSDVSLQLSQIKSTGELDREDLIKRALASRPDLRAAELAVEAAGKKCKWENTRIFNLTAVLDASGKGKEDFEMGPGLEIDLPLFDWNSGGRARASAELKQAAKNYWVVMLQIRAEVLHAYNDRMASGEELALLRDSIVPSAATAVQMAKTMYDVGEISYIEFLNLKRQWLEAQIREAETEAEMRRSNARLEFSIGSRLSTAE